MSAPTWLVKILDSFNTAVERGVGFRHGLYYLEGRFCAVGWLAKDAGASKEVLKTADDKRIEMDDVSCSFIRRQIIEHFDGEAPEEVEGFLRRLQRVNDRQYYDTVDDRITPQERAEGVRDFVQKEINTYA